MGGVLSPALSPGPERPCAVASLSAWCQRCSVQLADVVGDGHQGPFTVDLLQPPQQEAIQAPCPFDLTKDWFGDGLLLRRSLRLVCRPGDLRAKSLELLQD
jgi:hypothetical protein